MSNELKRTIRLKPIPSDSNSYQQLAETIFVGTQIAEDYSKRFVKLKSNIEFKRLCLDSETRINSKPAELARSIFSPFTNKNSTAFGLNPHLTQMGRPRNTKTPESEKGLKNKEKKDLNEEKMRSFIKSFWEKGNLFPDYKDKEYPSEFIRWAFKTALETISSHFNNNKKNNETKKAIEASNDKIIIESLICSLGFIKILSFLTKDLFQIKNFEKTIEASLKENDNELKFEIEDILAVINNEMYGNRYTPPSCINNPQELEYSESGGSNKLKCKIENNKISFNSYNNKSCPIYFYSSDKRIFKENKILLDCFMVQFSKKGKEKIKHFFHDKNFYLSFIKEISFKDDDFYFTGIKTITKPKPLLTMKDIHKTTPVNGYDRGQINPICEGEIINGKESNRPLKRRFQGNSIEHIKIGKFRKIDSELRALLKEIRILLKVNNLDEAKIKQDKYCMKFEELEKYSNLKEIRNVYFRVEMIESIAYRKKDMQNFPKFKNGKIIYPKYKAQIPDKVWDKIKNIKDDNEKQIAFYLNKRCKKEERLLALEDLSGNKSFNNKSKASKKAWKVMAAASQQNKIIEKAQEMGNTVKLIDARGTSSHIDGLPALKCEVKDDQIKISPYGRHLVSLNENSALIRKERDPQAAINIARVAVGIDVPKFKDESSETVQSEEGKTKSKKVRVYETFSGEKTRKEFEKEILKEIQGYNLII